MLRSHSNSTFEPFFQCLLFNVQFPLTLFDFNTSLYTLLRTNVLFNDLLSNTIYKVNTYNLKNQNNLTEIHGFPVSEFQIDGNLK